MSNASSASLFAATQAIDDAWSKLVQQLQAVAMTVVNTPNTLDLASKALLGVTTDTNLRADEQNWAARVQDLRNESSSLGSRVQQLQMDGRQQSQDHTARIVVSTNKTLEAFLKLAVALRGKVFPNSNPESAPKDIIERLLEIQAKARAGTRATSEGYLALSKLSEQVCFSNSHESIGASANVPLIRQSILEALASQSMQKR